MRRNPKVLQHKAETATRVVPINKEANREHRIVHQLKRKKGNNCTICKDKNIDTHPQNREVGTQNSLLMTDGVVLNINLQKIIQDNLFTLMILCLTLFRRFTSSKYLPFQLFSQILVFYGTEVFIVTSYPPKANHSFYYSFFICSFISSFPLDYHYVL